MADNNAIIKDFLSGPDQSEVVRRLLAATGLDESIFTTKERTNRLCRIRFAMMHAIKTATSLSYPEIGEMFNREHTSVMHGVEKSTALADADEGYRGVIDAFCNVILETER